MGKSHYKLKKGPEAMDFLVEVIAHGPEMLVTNNRYFGTRQEARDFAKAARVRGTRCRIFHIKYTLVQDMK